MSKDKLRAKQVVKVNLWAVVSDAVERGTRVGWKRAHKHTDEPDEETIAVEIHLAIMNELAEYLDFGAP